MQSRIIWHDYDSLRQFRKKGFSSTVTVAAKRRKQLGIGSVHIATHLTKLRLSFDVKS